MVAEGVETVEQVDFLRAENCAELQGYHIGRPAPVETHTQMIHTGQTAASRPKFAVEAEPTPEAGGRGNPAAA